MNQEGQRSIEVIIPAFNERQALPGLIDEIRAACERMPHPWRVTVVDDGSTDGTFEYLKEVSKEDPRIGGLRLRRNFGKSDALNAGFARSTGDIVITIDGDGQDDPVDIPRLLSELDKGFDVVSGWERDRRDPLSRRLASKVFNFFSTQFTDVSMHDMNCGFKAYRGECARSLDIYGELHRYIPALAAQEGWRVSELAVNHRTRKHGRSRYGLERYRRGAFDLLTVLFLGRYRHRPLHLFGALGAGLAALGALACVYLTALWFGGEAIGDRPLLILGVLLLVLGAQLFTFGLLAQMMVIANRGADGALHRSARTVAESTDKGQSPTAAGSER